MVCQSRYRPARRADQPHPLVQPVVRFYRVFWTPELWQAILADAMVRPLLETSFMRRRGLIEIAPFFVSGRQGSRRRPHRRRGRCARYRDGCVMVVNAGGRYGNAHPSSSVTRATTASFASRPKQSDHGGRTLLSSPPTSRLRLEQAYLGQSSRGGKAIFPCTIRRRFDH